MVPIVFIKNVYRLFAEKDDSKSENTASRISTQSKHSTKEEFLSKFQVKNIVELLDVDQVLLFTSVQLHKITQFFYKP